MRAVQAAIVVVVVWFVRRTLLGALDELRAYHLHLHFGWLIAAGVLGLLGFLPAGLFWHRLLRVLGQDAELGETLRAYYVGQLGKYVPGKFMVIVIRTGMIRSHRVQTSLAVLSVFFETLTMMAVGGFLAAAVLAILFRQQRWLFLAGIGSMLVVGLPTFPPIFRRLSRLAGVGRSDPDTAARVDRLGYGTLLLGWLAMTVGWLFTALSLWAVLHAMGVSGLDAFCHFAYYLGSVSLSKVAGFISLIPAGVVVTDLTLTELLRLYGINVLSLPDAQATALVAAVLLRLVWLVAEIVISVILYAVGRRMRKNVSCDAADESLRIGASP
jgi:uncharacterized membrane protein YbhN (UPF0104 family)